MTDRDEKNKHKNNLNLRSDEIKDIMSRSPMWVVRWGISTVFVIIILGIIATWFMKYPDIIKGQVSVTNLNPPVKVVSQSNGNIVSLKVNEGDVVEKGTLMAELENPLSAKSVDKLKKYVAQVEAGMNSGSGYLPLVKEAIGSLGDLQIVMNDLQNEIRTFNLRGSFRMDDKELASLRNQLANEQRLSTINNGVFKLAEDEYVNAKIRYEADKSLYEDKVISQADFIQSQSQYNQKKIQYEKAKLAKVQNQINISSLETRIQQNQFSKVSKEKSGYGAIMGHLETIRSYIHGWQQKNTLVAPVSGTVTFLSHLRNGLHVKFDEELFAIIQKDNKYIAHGTVPVVGAGKVKIGQDVSILLENFPSHEYGVIVGKVKYIAAIPTNSSYRVEIALPNGLTSTYNQELVSSSEMLGNIEIITEDKRVLQRIMQSILKLFESR